MLNTQKIEKQMISANISKENLCSRIHIEQTTLDAILNGGDAKVSTIEAIAQELHINIGFLFDEEERIEIREAGRDYVEKGKIEHNGTEYNAPVSSRITDLEKENAELKRKLIAAQERIIGLIDNQTK
ncbi:MAG: helix-turn-helix domain-containing protein [Muribaculum sp.]|nr:helix-turn-helix domain-containing protein [Muribaculum sp.]